jgi:hypothetical protein
LIKVKKEEMRIVELCQELSDPEPLEKDYLKEKTKCTVKE